MKSKQNTNIRLNLDTLGLPTVFIKIHGGIGFLFLIDTSMKHNLLDPCFMEWIVTEQPTEEQLAAPEHLEDGTYNWEHHRFPVKVIHQEKGQKRIICKDGTRRVCDMIKLDFTVENMGNSEEYSELFALDPSMCPYFLRKKTKAIAGVLGNDFLKKHKWVLDYSEMKPR